MLGKTKFGKMRRILEFRKKKVVSTLLKKSKLEGMTGKVVLKNIKLRRIRSKVFWKPIVNIIIDSLANIFFERNLFFSSFFSLV